MNVTYARRAQPRRVAELVAICWIGAALFAAMNLAHERAQRTVGVHIETCYGRLGSSTRDACPSSEPGAPGSGKLRSESLVSPCEKTMCDPQYGELAGIPVGAVAAAAFEFVGLLLLAAALALALRASMTLALVGAAAVAVAAIFGLGTLRLLTGEIASLTIACPACVSYHEGAAVVGACTAIALVVTAWATCDDASSRDWAKGLRGAAVVAVCAVGAVVIHAGAAHRDFLRRTTPIDSCAQLAAMFWAEHDGSGDALGLRRSDMQATREDLAVVIADGHGFIIGPNPRGRGSPGMFARARSLVSAVDARFGLAFVDVFCPACDRSLRTFERSSLHGTPVHIRLVEGGHVDSQTYDRFADLFEQAGANVATEVASERRYRLVLELRRQLNVVDGWHDDGFEPDWGRLAVAAATAERPANERKSRPWEIGYAAFENGGVPWIYVSDPNFERRTRAGQTGNSVAVIDGMPAGCGRQGQACLAKLFECVDTGAMAGPVPASGSQVVAASEVTP